MLAALLVPNASQCIAIGGPVLAIIGLVWFWHHGDAVIARLFPQLKWERELGWLNLRAHRRADRIMRGLTHVLHTLLLGALVGLLGFAWLLGQPHDTDSAIGLFSIPFEFIYLVFFLGIWIVYFVYLLAPRIRAEYEDQELKRWRAEHPEEVPEMRKRAGRFDVSVWDAGRPRRF